MKIGSNNPRKCPINQIILFKSETDYPDNPLRRQNGLDKVKLRMTNTTIGETNVYFAVGTRGNAHISDLAKGKIIINSGMIVTMGLSLYGIILIQFL
jgi:hypothetical protein